MPRKRERTFVSFDKKLTQVLSDIFEAAFDPDICAFDTINALAVEANLSWITVQNLYAHYRRPKQGTKEPRFSTIYKLAGAVNMDIQLLNEALDRKAVSV
jgi:hypothetical protein